MTTENLEKSQVKQYPFTFTGSANEYFAIWIINILLSIITLGIYSAWAKVRNKQYFYRNTIVADSSFEYSANPINILKGRIIAVLILGLYILTVSVFPAFTIVFIIIFYLLFPLFILKSLQFNARYSSYRNINFKFNGTLIDSYYYFLLYYLFAVVTLGLALPYVISKQYKFIINNNNYGETNFNFSAKAIDFYKIYFPILISTLPMIGFFIYGSIIGAFEPGVAQSPTQEIQSLYLAFGVSYIVFLLSYVFIIAYIRAKLFNLIFNKTNLSNIQFKSSVKTLSILGIMISNGIVSALTMGLMIPWAKIRFAKYYTSNLILTTQNDLEVFTAAEKEKSNSLGDEIGEVFDLDIGF